MPFLIDKNDKDPSPNYLFYNLTDLPNPTVTIPINIKLQEFIQKL